jgi:DNA-binding NarL/FixJ family response regulator
MSKPTVIIADDHALVAEGLARLLSTDYEVVAIVSNGRALIEESSRLRPDLICLDIAMPEMNGIQAAVRLSEILPHTKLIIVTQQLDLQYLKAAFRAGAVAYVAKQSASSELQIAIREAFAGKLYVTPLLMESASAADHDLIRNPASVFTDSLTARQREVLQLIAEGKTVKEIAAKLYISNKTVEFHKAGLMGSLGLRTTAELTRYAIKHKIVTPEETPEVSDMRGSG